MPWDISYSTLSKEATIMKFTRKRFLLLFLVMLAVLGLLTAVPVALRS